MKYLKIKIPPKSQINLFANDTDPLDPLDYQIVLAIKVIIIKTMLSYV